MSSTLLIKGCKTPVDSFQNSFDVLIEKNIIKQVTEKEINVDNIKTLNAQGKHLIPGLIDCHVHLILDGSPNTVEYVEKNSVQRLIRVAEKNALTSLQHGITTLRDMGCTGFIVPKLREKIKKNQTTGPRIIAAGHMITKKKGHIKRIAREIKDEQDLKKAIKEQKKGGADFIKLIVSGGLLTPNSKPTDTEFEKTIINKAVEEASKHGLKTAAHVYSDKDTKNVLDANVWSIEHASYASAKTLKKAAEKKVFLVPTLKAAYNILENTDSLPKHVVENANSVIEAANKTIPKAIKQNVPLAMGTDAGTPFNYHGENAMELQYLYEMSLTNEKLIETATINPAKLLGLHKTLGKVEKGYKADLLLLKTNPLDDIKALKTGVEYVIKDGVIIKNSHSL